MTFDVNKLAEAIQAACSSVVFALLHGSAKDGRIRPGGDLDIAVFADGKPSLDLYHQVLEAVRSVVPEAEPDVGILNTAEPVYRFEALKGRLLFCRDASCYGSFFSLACREYESQMADYRRQHRYRLEANHPSNG